jgi:hypothetical protein
MCCRMDQETKWVQQVSTGVCDSPEQWAQENSDFSGQVWFVPVLRCEQPLKDGWSWPYDHRYIGKFKLGSMTHLVEADGTNGNPKIDVQYVFWTGNDKRQDIGIRSPVQFEIQSGKIQNSDWESSWQWPNESKSKSSRMETIRSMVKNMNISLSDQQCSSLFNYLFRKGASPLFESP